MRFYIIRHGTASHLLENLNRKVNRYEFISLLEKWKKATLTSEGEREIELQVKALGNNFSYLYFSPLNRTKQTALAFFKALDKPTHTEALAELIEIYITPPYIPFKISLRLKYWIALCVLKSLYTFKIFIYLKEARNIIKSIKKVNDNVLIISHQARIATIIIYCLINPRWKVVKTDFSPGGISIVEKR